MLFTAFAFILSILVSFELVLNVFFPFYSDFSELVPFFIICGVATLVIWLPLIGKRLYFHMLFAIVFPFVCCYLFCFNFFALAICIILGLFSAIFYLPKKTFSERLMFTSEGIFSVKTYKRRTVFSTYLFSVTVAEVLAFLALALTFIFPSPSYYWQTHRFPIDKTVLVSGEQPIVSGAVTMAVWQDDTSMLVSDFFDIGEKPSPAREAGLLPGDIVTKIDGVDALDSDFITSGPKAGAAVTFTVLRRDAKEEDYEEIDITLSPIYSKEDDAWRVGLNYYQGATMGATVQTLSFFYPKRGLYAATAHSSDGFIDKYSPSVGLLLTADVTRIDAGGLIAEPIDIVGNIDFTNNYGTFGTIDRMEGVSLPIAQKSEVKRGKAVMRSAFEGGEIKEYEVFITGTYRIDGRDVLTLLVTDEHVRALGGVRHGMSGSPIVQNGKIIAALSNMDAGGYSAYATFAADMAHEIDLFYEEQDK